MPIKAVWRRCVLYLTSRKSWRSCCNGAPTTMRHATVKVAQDEMSFYAE
jgi:hypothetical protein